MSVYARLLRLFPREFRARFGDDMAEVFSDRLRVARSAGAAAVTVGIRMATAGYFPAIGVPLRRGHNFSDAAADHHTVIVNDLAARAMWGDADPIGRQFRMGRKNDPATQGPVLTVVGVVGSVRHDALTHAASPEIFQPYADNTWNTMTMVVRTNGDPVALAGGVRGVMREIDPRLALEHLGPASGFVDHELAEPRFGVLCASVFGLVGLGLAACGTFAVLSLLVAQRTREIGIRMALGATPGRVRWLVLRDALVPACLGCAAGAIAAAWLTRLLSTMLFGVSALDARAFTAVVAILLGAALGASWWPTRRAMRVDPIRALRAD